MFLSELHPVKNTVTMADEDTDVFEITDFTTASAWERFIARLEEVVHDWKLLNKPSATALTKNELSTGQWIEESETVQFADFVFKIYHHYLKQDVHPTSSALEDAETTASDEISHSSSISDMTLDSPTGNESRVIVPESRKPSKKDTPQVWADMMSCDNDFPPRSHCLSRWYGLREFVVLSPASKGDNIGSESRLNIVLSSISIALHNTGCQVPIFVQADKQWRRLFFGQCELPGFRTNFEMVHLKYIPSSYKHLSGLVDMFKSKLNCPLPLCPSVSVAVRFTYVLQEWSHYIWPQMPPDIESATGGEVGCAEFSVLPFGACEDPVSELHLSVTWPSLSEELIVDSNVYSDLDPLHAPNWCARIRVQDNAQCLLSDYLSEFVTICRRHESSDQLLGKLVHEEDEASIEAALALQKLTQSSVNPLSSLGNVVTKATSKLQVQAEEVPISADLLNQILVFIFPDVKSDNTAGASTPDSRNNTKQSAERMCSSANTTNNEALDEIQEKFCQFKSGPMDSVVSRLAVCMCIINYSYGGIRAVTHLWREFVLEMRFRWENNFLIPDLEKGVPNMGSSVLYQKLQMLNCCIDHKRNREKIVASGPAILRSRSEDSSDSNDVMPSDDEFFECEEDGETNEKDKDKTTEQGWDVESDVDMDDLEDDCGKDNDTEKDNSGVSKKADTSTSAPESFTESWTHQPDGRLRVCPDGTKLLNQQADMYIPITQEPAPMTEDMLDEHAEVLTRLGSSAEGAHLRARMQSACLMSDMEAFKAANPGCVIGDFVRWYSPRDWITEERENDDGAVVNVGALSQRMQIPGNIWLEAWQTTKPVPVRKQKRLFDDTKEAEKVLHFLSSMKPSEVAFLVLPMIVHSSAETVVKQKEACLSIIQKSLSEFVQRSIKVLRIHNPEPKHYEELVKQLIKLELLITQVQSLKTKFRSAMPNTDGTECDQVALDPAVEAFISDIIEHPEVNIIGAKHGKVGGLIHALFAAAQKSPLDVEADTSDVESVTQKSTENSSFPSASVTPTDFPIPSGKEYLLRTIMPRPAPWSRPAPQRMYCVIVKDDYRFAGAFSADTTFQ